MKDILLKLPDQLYDRIVEYRTASGIPSTNETVRSLVMLGLTYKDKFVGSVSPIAIAISKMPPDNDEFVPTPMIPTPIKRPAVNHELDRDSLVQFGQIKRAVQKGPKKK